MAIEFKKPSEVALQQGLKALVYGSAGSGKTVLCATGDHPTLIISAEAGLLSIRDVPGDITVTEVHNLDEVGAVYQHLLKDDHYNTVALDSITEIAEQCLFEELKKSGKDPRKAYGELIQKMSSVIRLFRDLPGKDVIMTAKIERIADDSSRLLYSPAMPGAKLGAALPYFFDLVCPLRVEKDREGALHRWLQTGTDGQYIAKDRSGALEMFEEPSIAQIKATILGTKSTKKAA
jgi:hypothetical protein